MNLLTVSHKEPYTFGYIVGLYGWYDAPIHHQLMTIAMPFSVLPDYKMGMLDGHGDRQEHHEHLKPGDLAFRKIGWQGWDPIMELLPLHSTLTKVGDQPYRLAVDPFAIFAGERRHTLLRRKTKGAPFWESDRDPANLGGLTFVD